MMRRDIRATRRVSNGEVGDAKHRTRDMRRTALSVGERVSGWAAGGCERGALGSVVGAFQAPYGCEGEARVRVTRVSSHEQVGEESMEVHGVGSVGGTGPIQPAATPRPTGPVEASQAAEVRDADEISEVGKLLDDLSRIPEIRSELVAELRRQIEAGTYETPEKLELAVDRLLSELRGEEPR